MQYLCNDVIYSKEIRTEEYYICQYVLKRFTFQHFIVWMSQIFGNKICYLVIRYVICVIWKNYITYINKKRFSLKWLVPTNIIHKLRFRFPFNNNYKWKNDEGKIFQTYAIVWFLLKIYDLTNNYHEPTTSNHMIYKKQILVH